MAASGLKRWVIGVGYVLVGLGGVAGAAVFIVWLVHDWRAGTAFTRYRNWEGHMVSHADLLIVMVVSIAALILGGVWRWWEHRREDRMIRDARKRRQAHPKAPG